MQSCPLTLDKLACPECDHQPLVRRDDGLLDNGLPGNELLCAQCGVAYPVVAGIPRLLRRDNQARTRLDEVDYNEGLDDADEVSGILIQNWQGIFSDYGVLTGDVLELGCGSGYLTQVLAGSFGFSTVHAVDISPVFLDMARNKLDESSRQKTCFYMCDANFLPFATGAFDVVIGRSVLHHFLDYEKILARIARMLRPGGCGVFYEPVIQGKAKIALMAQLILMINNRLAEPVFDEAESEQIRRLHKHLVKELTVGSDRNKREQMEDKYIFDIHQMQRLGRELGFAKVEYRNWVSRDGLYRIGLEQHLVALGIPRDKVRRFTFLTRAWRENIVRLLPEDQYTPMGFFIFQK